MSQAAFEYIRQAYSVPAAVNVRVFFRHRAQFGTITGADGQYILVRFDGETRSLPCHPTWEMEYNPK